MIWLAFVILIVPGLAWWAWLGRRREDPLVSLAQIVGVSFAIIILLAQLGFLLGVRFTRLGIFTFVFAFAVLAAVGLVKKGVHLQQRYRLHLWIGLLLFGLAIAWRIFQAKDLLLPNWVDSQHHFLIIQAILKAGGVPQDLSPVLPMPFYYHYGFHALAALFTAISGLPIGNAMLMLGQVLNAAVGLSTYALGKSLWRNWRPALAAALLVSFATRMPAYYLSWGRYTLITGILLLPLAMALAVNLLRGKNRRANGLAMALLTASLLLSHYFAALLLAIFLVLMMIVHLVQGRGHLPQSLMQVSWVLNSAAFGLVLAAPWLWRVATYMANAPRFETSLPESIGEVFSTGGWDYIWLLLGPSSNHWLLVPAGVGLIILLFTRFDTGFGLWALALALLSLPWGATLRPFRSDHFAIVLFLPVTLLTGFLLWAGARWVGYRLKQRWVTALILALVVLGWIAWGFTQMRYIVNPATVLVSEADLDALNWVAEQTPADARFFINTAYWLANTYRGADGGGWLLPYTGRWALVPTVFYGFSPDAAWVGELRGWGEAASQVTTCSADFWALVEEAELDWIYLRSGSGSLQPGGLHGCEGIEEEYANQQVYIYRIQADKHK